MWTALLLISSLCGSGCEEELPPIMDADTPFALILAQGTDREVCVLTYYKLSNLREDQDEEDREGEVPEISEEEQIVVTVWRVTEEVQNAGFRGALMLALEDGFELESVRSHFEVLGLDECAGMLGEVQGLLPDELPDEPRERWSALNEIGADAFFPFDEQYRKIIESGRLEIATAAFIRSNASALSYLK